MLYDGMGRNYGILDIWVYCIRELIFERYEAEIGLVRSKTEETN